MMTSVLLPVEAQGVVHTEKAIFVAYRVIVMLPETTVEVNPMALVGHPPPKRRFTASGGLHGPYGADLSVFTSEEMD